MVDGQFFDKLEEIARDVRRDVRPFGGICGAPVLHPTPLIVTMLSGDFFQFPPVPDSINGQKLRISFACDAKKWPTCIQEMTALIK